MKTVEYEWDWEKLFDDAEHDADEVQDHWHSDRLIPENPWAPDKAELCLVCNDFAGGWVRGRSWAYVKDGKLPEWFTDAYGHRTRRVPQRFHKELAAALKA